MTTSNKTQSREPLSPAETVIDAEVMDDFIRAVLADNMPRTDEPFRTVAKWINRLRSTTPTEPQAGADNYDDFPLAIHGRPLDGPAQPVSGDREAIARIVRAHVGEPYASELTDELVAALRAPAQGDGVQNMAEALSRAGERCGLASLNERTKTHYLKLAATALATLPPSTGVERGKEGATLDGLRRIIRLTATRKPEDFDAIYDEATKLHRALNAPTPSASRVDHASVVEECAKVADAELSNWFNVGAGIACQNIAANIRSLAALQSQDQIHDGSSERVRSPVDRAVEGGE